MPKISDLPADTAPASTDLIPFVDVDAARTESVTVANLAASAAFAGQYAPLAVIETQTLALASSAVTFSAIPQTFNSLRLLVSGRTSGATAGIAIRFNSDSGSNYDWVRQQYRGGTSAARSDTATEGTSVIEVGRGSSSGVFSFVVDIPHYTDATFGQPVTSGCFTKSNTNPATWVSQYGGMWTTVGAITAIEVGITATLAIGTKLTLIGVL